MVDIVDMERPMHKRQGLTWFPDQDKRWGPWHCCQSSISNRQTCMSHHGIVKVTNEKNRISQIWYFPVCCPIICDCRSFSWRWEPFWPLYYCGFLLWHDERTPSDATVWREHGTAQNSITFWLKVWHRKSKSVCKVLNLHQESDNRWGVVQVTFLRPYFIRNTCSWKWHNLQQKRFDYPAVGAQTSRKGFAAPMWCAVPAGHLCRCRAD